MPNFEEALNYLRDRSTDMSGMGRSFERLMKTALGRKPGILGDRFDKIWLWDDWPERDGPDMGIDLVAQEREGGLCAIQCKFYAPDNPVPTKDINSFLAATIHPRFTSCMFINTGGAINKNSVRKLQAGKPCRVLEKDEMNEWPVDWLEYVNDPESLQFQTREPYIPHPYQEEAVKSVIDGFTKHDRGQLILPCGTGKTAVALWIAEKQAGIGGRVLYLVPSIALMAQTMREWSAQRSLPLRYLGICSDTRVGRTDEDASMLELDYPVTTDLEKIKVGLCKERLDALTVVFCTYQSLELVETAQSEGAPVFDLVICDEAHRTTGVEEATSSKDTSPFRIIHNNNRIRARKRLYSTATPRLYTDSAKSKSVDRNIEVFSMDDEAVYGAEFYRMNFSKAVDEGWLTDYKVVILTLKSEQAAAALENHLATAEGSDLNLDDAVKLLGCWDALADPEGRLSGRNISGDQHDPLMRAIAFTNTIKVSKIVEEQWPNVIEASLEQVDNEARENLLPIEIKHVDGTQNSLDRQSKLAWLKNENGEPSKICRVLSNARCLTEGVDVPALDAVLFLSPRKSHIDVVQAVGRVMRRAEGKEMGYIILPVVVNPDDDPVQALNNNKTFQVVWSVLRALRSHDDRFDNEINCLDLNNSPTKRIVIFGDSEGEDSEQDPSFQLSLDLVHRIPPGAIYAQIVEKCGDRKYWRKWGEDVARIADNIRIRITGLVSDPSRITFHEGFQSFLADLRQTLNPSLSEEDLVAMVAQHLVTGPVFQALFADYDFAGKNPVSQALSRLVELLEDTGLENELRGLEEFYDSVRRRVQTLDNADARYTVLLELYERFFKVALEKDAQRLGIVYTPIEVVDFILHSADHALQKHFGRRLTSEDVHILDPFAGTGTFIVRLLQNPELIQNEDLVRKFQSELHANEIVLLAYYIAAINIEETYHGRSGMEKEYAPFDGVVFTDTFTLGEGEGQFAETFPVNSERVERQQGGDITVIVGNPPYSIGQKSTTDENPNVSYPHLAARIEETYAARSTAVNKSSLYDSYKLAVRWASDRIEDQGIIAFVTNGSFISGNAESGLRACLAEEFFRLYVFNLRGNANTSGERRKREMGNVFGGGTKTPVAIMVLVRDSALIGECQILYKDIGDYLSREEKLRILKENGSIACISDWQQIKPDQHHDWLKQRDPEYQRIMPLAIKSQKLQPDVSATFQMLSKGLATNRDLWVYSFDRLQLCRNVETMTKSYEDRRQSVLAGKATVEEAGRNNNLTHIKWTRGLRYRLERNERLELDPSNFRQSMYRPFCKQHVYFDSQYNEYVFRIPSMFPSPGAMNQLIGVTGRGADEGFYTFMSDVIPDYNLLAAGVQCFSRWRYETHDPDSPAAWVHSGDEGLEDVPGYRRIDNITDWCLESFRQQYPTLQIGKDDIWYYIYGLLHAPDYREKYRADLSKDLPRIPFAPDFGEFRDAGEEMATLHLGYETCPQFELQVDVTPAPTPYDLSRKPMQWGGTKKDQDRSVLHVTPWVTLKGIPDEAHRYVVNGRTPLEWAIDRLLIRQDKFSKIVNDPNAWFVENPAGVVAHLKRLVHVSVETTRIVEGIPPALSD